MSLYAKSKYLAKLIKIKFTKKYFPINVTICITGKCNLKCIYCYGDFYSKTRELEMSTEQILHIIDGLHKMGTQYISVSGGEPLLQKDIGLIIDHIKSKGCECTIATNGFLLPNKINEIKNVDLLAISLDGNELENDLNRGKGCFKKTMKGIETALIHKIPVVINSVLTKNNINSIDYLCQIGKLFKIKIKFGLLVYSDDKRKKNIYDDIALNDIEIKNAIKKIIELKKNGAPILYSLKAYDLSFQWKDHSKIYYWNEIPDFSYAKCYAGKMFFHIDSDSSVYPCCVFFDSFKAKKIVEVGLENALKHAETQNLCKACAKPGYIEHNLIYGLDPYTVYSNILEIFK
ncbi:radical SAM protein [Candidatus Dependentiae bacterium]|nr:radical SAM protein [Candidatus Dependentiae bacterium]